MEVKSKITNKSSWVYPLFWKGWRTESLSYEHLSRCSKDDEALVVVQQLESNWDIERRKRNPKFW
ncbi:unnamed protein product, partial [Medioppia subpectinata]